MVQLSQSDGPNQNFEYGAGRSRNRNRRELSVATGAVPTYIMSVSSDGVRGVNHDMPHSDMFHNAGSRRLFGLFF